MLDNVGKRFLRLIMNVKVIIKNRSLILSSK